MRTRRSSLVLTILSTLIPMSTTLAQAIDYPETRKVDVSDDFHGTAVADPYRWLEDDARVSSDVSDWVERQNALTFSYLESLDRRDAIKARLTELVDYERYSGAFAWAGRYYYFYNNGLQNQSVLYSADSLEGEPQLVLDPNSWSEDGTVAMAGGELSEDGRYLAYGRSVAGSDWTEWRILDLRTGEEFDDLVEWIKYTSISWNSEGTGFYYSRFDAPADEAAFQALNVDHKVYFHELGTPQSQDRLVYSRPDEPTWLFEPLVSDDGRYLIVHVFEGTDPRNRLFYLDLQQDGAEFVRLIDDFESEYTFLGNDGPVFYFKTDLDAPNRRIVSIDTTDAGAASAVEIVPQSSNAMQSASMVGDAFVLSYLEDVVTQVLMFGLEGELIREIALPGRGAASGFSAERSDTETFYSYESFDTPATLYHYDFETDTSRVFRQPTVDFDPDDYVVEQVFYESGDGTRVPMFIAHRRDLPLDGERPTLLYGYGGFDISLTPSFSMLRLAWMEMGGVFASANLRGGGEYGRQWHEAGKRDQKQNVFDDFIAAAEWLIDNDYTSREHLAIEGSSNGGLLVGAVMAQRPELFAAALPDVGVMDMLRFHRFTAGRYWTDDFGNPDDPEEFPALYAYSPYHNLQPAEYPATLVTTADTDDRVVPGHSFKFAARLQEMQRGEEPVLIRVETRAGHGGGKPIEKVIEEVADQYAFLVEHIF